MNEKELKRRYGIMVLGVFRRNDKKRAFGFVDKWLDKMEGVSGREMEDSRTFEVVAANALNYMEQDRAADVILVGTVETEKLEQVRAGLASMLGAAALSVGGNLGKMLRLLRKLQLVMRSFLWNSGAVPCLAESSRSWILSGVSAKK